MKKLNGYANAQVYQDREKLPAGQYVCKVLGVAYDVATSNDANDKITISFDIVEGEYKDFYTNQYKSSTDENKKWKGNFRITVPKDDGTVEDNRTQNRFKTTISTFEESNPGFHWDWDENKLKGLLFGGLFRDKEYSFNGRTGFWTECYGIASVAIVREGKAKLSGPKMLSNNPAPAEAPTSPDGFMNIPSGMEDELPFA